MYRRRLSSGYRVQTAVRDGRYGTGTGGVQTTAELGVQGTDGGTGRTARDGGPVVYRRRLSSGYRVQTAVRDGRHGTGSGGVQTTAELGVQGTDGGTGRTARDGGPCTDDG